MAYRGTSPAGAIHTAARYKSCEKQFHPEMRLASDGFDIWWRKTFAQHTAVVEQAYALMRAHRQSSSTGEAHVGQAF